MIIHQNVDYISSVPFLSGNDVINDKKAMAELPLLINYVSIDF
jgi:hypothetical protein